MCRVFGVLLKPISYEHLFFKRAAQGDGFLARTSDEIIAQLQERREQVSLLATDCAKRSTKAGYDAAGLGVGVMDVKPLLDLLPAPGRTIHKHEIAKLFPENISARILISKDGGDFLETHKRLEERLLLEPTHFIYAWTVHIRQASQGDMYSAVNAHPHTENRVGEEPFFSTMHNGDVLDADTYKQVLSQFGFQFFSNADSCVIPALQRFIFEALKNGNLAQSLEGVALLGSAQTYAELIRISKAMQKNGAQLATVASAITARILGSSNHENKFVFQSLSPHGATIPGYLGSGTLNIVRGGTREGGEEGGEAMCYLPYPEDKPNAELVTAMVGSEENALKDRVHLIDLKELEVADDVRESKPLIEELPHLSEQFPELRAKTLITEGGLPIFDILPGEILEIRADGQVALFDYYSGDSISLKRMRKEWNDPKGPQGKARRIERMTRLKRFQVEYRNVQGQNVASPFNTYGEEIIVVQPKALRDNTQKLFRKTEDGFYEIIPGRRGLGIWMGTDDRADRANSIRKLDFKLVGAAGTSFLIAQIAENMCRKLGLHRIPTMVMEGFTGSDALPAHVSRNTFFVANSNSGGTSDTIKLTRELTATVRLCHVLLQRYQHAPANEENTKMVERLEAAMQFLQAGGKEEEMDGEILSHIRDLSPYIFAITNIEASPLGDMGRGLDKRIFRPAGAGVTNLPEEECVGSTFAAMASLQWQMALDTYLGEVRGNISHDYARTIYQSLAKLPEVCDRIVNNAELARSIREFADRCVGGNNDFIYTGYVNGIPEEQAHKFAEMIQTMAVGWHYFMFQHGKYAHVRRASRHALGSIVGHNVPPPSWTFFNARARKAPREIKARAAIMFAIAHESDREELLDIPDYGVDYVFAYPEDDLVLYPFQVIIISHLISYYWGLELTKISDQIAAWNEGFIAILEQTPKGEGKLGDSLRKDLGQHATTVLSEMTKLYTGTHRFDTAEVRRMNAIFRDLFLLADGTAPERSVAVDILMGSPKVCISLKGEFKASRDLSDAERLTLLKDLALEISTAHQAKRIADLFLTDDNGKVLPLTIRIKELNGSERVMSEYDYWCQYEGLGEFFHVNPIHPPKIAKAKKGWL